MSTSDKQRQQQPDEVDEAKGSEHSAQLEAALKSGTLGREDLRTIYTVKRPDFPFGQQQNLDHSRYRDSSGLWCGCRPRSQ